MKAKHFIPVVGLWLTNDNDFESIALEWTVVFGLYHTLCSFVALVGFLILIIEIIF